MYSKIICPIDFSKASFNAAEYAAKLAQAFWCELLLLHVEKTHPVFFSASYDVNPLDTPEQRAMNDAARLQKISDDISKKFHITATYEVTISGRRLVKSLSGGSERAHLFVMGTRGAENIFEHLLGTRSYRLAREVNSTILIVPEGLAYNTVEKILVIITDKNASGLELEKLDIYLSKFHTHITFLNTGGVDTYETCRKQVNEFYKQRLIDIDFWNKHNAEVVSVLNELAGDNQFDLIVMQEPELTFTGKLFYGDPVKKISGVIKTPLLVIHSSPLKISEN